MHPELYASNVDFHGDLHRNIPGIRESQDLFDDLSADPADWDVAAAAESASQVPTRAALITRPFDYGVAVGRAFDSAHWVATRFSDGREYGVWYGSRDLATTVYETAWHWYRFVRASFAAEDRDIVTDRRAFVARCDALLLDLRTRHTQWPQLVDRSSYAFTHEIGRYVHEQGLNGLLVRSARCSGINAAIFKPERLSRVRDRAFLTYRLNVVRDTLVVERTRGRKWLQIRPSALA